jgi:hypothetical protein
MRESESDIPRSLWPLLRRSTAFFVLWLAPMAQAAPETGEVAPDFAITGADAATISALKGKMPVAIIFLPSGKAIGVVGERWKDSVAFLRELSVALEERDIQVVLVSERPQAWPKTRPVATPTGKLDLIRHAYHTREGAFLGVLVGVDGRVLGGGLHPFAASLPIYALPKRAH